MTWVLGSGCISTPGLYRSPGQLAQVAVSFGLFSPTSDKLEQQTFRVRKALKISPEICPSHRAARGSVAVESGQCLRLLEVPSVARGWMWDPCQPEEDLGQLSYITPAQGLSIHVSQFVLLSALCI